MHAICVKDSIMEFKTDILVVTSGAQNAQHTS